MNHIAVNTHVEVLVYTYVFRSLVIYLGMKSLGFFEEWPGYFPERLYTFILISDA